MRVQARARVDEDDLRARTQPGKEKAGELCGGDEIDGELLRPRGDGKVRDAAEVDDPGDVDERSSASAATHPEAPRRALGAREVGDDRGCREGRARSSARSASRTTRTSRSRARRAARRRGGRCRIRHP
jgi:hypothetical protein